MSEDKLNDFAIFLDGQIEKLKVSASLHYQTTNINLKLFKMTTKHYTTITHNGIELELTGIYAKGRDAYISGPPDDCYEGENPTFEVDEITLIDSTINIISLFSSDDIDEIESKAVDNLTD